MTPTGHPGDKPPRKPSRKEARARLVLADVRRAAWVQDVPKIHRLLDHLETAGFKIENIAGFPLGVKLVRVAGRRAGGNPA